MDGPKISRLYYTTRDVCEIAEVPPHTLRRWEKRFPFVKPTRRRSGRRLFKPQDLEVVLMIKKLKDEGYTDEGVAEILNPADERANSVAKPQEETQVDALIHLLQEELSTILRILQR